MLSMSLKNYLSMFYLFISYSFEKYINPLHTSRHPNNQSISEMPFSNEQQGGSCRISSKHILLTSSPSLAYLSLHP